MGVEPFLVASSVRAFLAQRLVRRLCEQCREPHPQPGLAAKAIGLELPSDGELYQAREGGCDHCRGTGFHGRFAIYEIVRVTEEMGEAVCARAARSELHQLSVASGFLPMREYGWEKVVSGHTTVEEVLSATAGEG